MVNKIGDVPVPMPSQRSGKAGTSSPNISSRSDQASPTTAPAVRIDLSESLLAAQMAGNVTPAEPFDSQLVQEIRDRIDSGRFQIDFNEVASNLLREAITSVRGSRP
jgi:flagellar biosynthesis anti-sigma factor FlgM